MAVPVLGAHVSTAGGVSRAIARGEASGCQAIQIFVKNPSRWRSRPIPEPEIEAFRRALSNSSLVATIAHSGYLINLAATSEVNLERSRQALGEELDRCALLGIDALVVHPGAHLGTGETAAISRTAESLSQVLHRRPACSTRLLLENTAGQGTLIGHRLEQLAEIRAQVNGRDRVGICLDTCHAFAAGYALHQNSDYQRLLRDLGQLFEPGSISCVHLNDSRYPLGSRKDRHANIGEGEIGVELFNRLAQDPLLSGVPMILETPRGKDGLGHERDLELLRRLGFPCRRR